MNEAMRGCCFVSSVNFSYHELCGREFLESFLRFVDSTVWLQLWCDAGIEGHKVSDYAIPFGEFQDRVIRYDMGQLYSVRSFLSLIRRRGAPIFSTDPSERLHFGSGYDYRKDVRTFGLKGLALSEALSWYDPRYVFWVDADTVFRKPLSLNFLLDLFGDSSIVYFGRESPHSETGFVGIDRMGKGVEEFRQEYTKCWTEGKVFDLSGWTDSHVFDHALAKAKLKGLRAKNLSTLPRGHVVPSSVLGPYLEHRKGPRKLAI
jgi:hypothetical protein